MAVSEISTGDHSEGADGRERARLRATQGVFAITIANEFALETTWQIQVTRDASARPPLTGALHRPIQLGKVRHDGNDVLVLDKRPD